MDTEVQSLVYDNYNKFIAATDTVKTIRTKVDGMANELEKLRKNILNMNNLYENIDDKMAYNWNELRKLDVMQKDLDKLNFLRDLPRIINEAIKDFQSKMVSISVFREPIKKYLRSSHLLEKYKNTVHILYIHIDHI